MTKETYSKPIVEIQKFITSDSIVTGVSFPEPPIEGGDGGDLFF